MQHPNDPGWREQKAKLRQLANDLLKQGPITTTEMLESVLLTAHLSGQQFALDTMRDTIQVSLYPTHFEKRGI